MDPHHGEISRAMRNRGVEIYVFGEVLELFYLAVCSNKESLTCTYMYKHEILLFFSKTLHFHGHVNLFLTIVCVHVHCCLNFHHQ